VIDSVRLDSMLGRIPCRRTETEMPISLAISSLSSISDETM